MENKTTAGKRPRSPAAAVNVRAKSASTPPPQAKRKATLSTASDSSSDNATYKCFVCNAVRDRPSMVIQTRVDSRQRASSFDVCPGCTNFAEIGPMPIEDLIRARHAKPGNKHDEAVEAHFAKQDEYAQNKADPSLRFFEPEEVTLKVTTRSIVEERLDIIEEKDFVQQHNCTFEEAQAAAVKGVTPRQKKFHGVLQETGKLQLVIQTETEISHDQVILERDGHLYEGQVDDVVGRHVGKHMKMLGMEHGQYYKPSMKGVQTYTADELANMSADAPAPSRPATGVASLFVDPSSGATRLPTSSPSKASSVGSQPTAVREGSMGRHCGSVVDRH